jgi:peptidoglycan/xylan/chitin deacetylase (PgdA/CDA1 family)
MINRAVRALACARGHRLILVYHRVGQPTRPQSEVIPSIPRDVFRAQLEALREIADLVSLDEILAEDGRRSAATGGRRPAVAVTFDDDLPSHVAHALPVLCETRVPAAFFLSGRALYGLGPYWFQQLEALLVVHGNARTAALLGVTSVEPERLAFACEREGNLRRRVRELATDVPHPGVLERDDVTALAAAGMTVGFHTVDHGILPGMDSEALQDAVNRGRDRLAAAAGTAVRYFAYPHGKADARSAAAVRHAGFDAAFTGRPEPFRQHDDRHRLGRWEPGPLAVDDLVVELAVRLHRAPAIVEKFPR